MLELGHFVKPNPINISSDFQSNSNFLRRAFLFISSYVANIRWVFRQLLEKDCEIEAVVLGTRYAHLVSLHSS